MRRAENPFNSINNEVGSLKIDIQKQGSGQEEAVEQKGVIEAPTQEDDFQRKSPVNPNMTG